jgi:hypothetical protein
MSKLLQDCGEALYGSRWQSDLARDLGISDRTVRRWVSGVDDPPLGIYTDLHRLVTERAQRLDDLGERLKKVG